MGNITQFPAKQRDAHPTGTVTGRDTYIAAQALTYAIAAIHALPDWRQEVSNARDMQALLAHIEPSAAMRKYLLEGVRWHLFDADQQQS